MAEKLRLYPYQEKAVESLLGGKNIIYATMGAGKLAISLAWLHALNPTHVLYVTTASKAKSGDVESEADMWFPAWRESVEKFTIISWHVLARWYRENFSSITKYLVVFDECLPADTKVKTKNGEVEIADLSVGDEVLSYSRDKNTTEYKKITRVIKKPSPSKMILLHLSNGTAIISTGNHPHFTQNGYVVAKDIKEGDTLYEMHELRERSRHKQNDGKAKIQMEKDRTSILLPKVWERIHRKGGETTKNEGENGDVWRGCILHKVWGADKAGYYPGVSVPALQKKWEYLLLQGTFKGVCGGDIEAEGVGRFQRQNTSSNILQGVQKGNTCGKNFKKSTWQNKKRKRDLLFGRLCKKDLLKYVKDLVEERRICKYEKRRNEKDDGNEQPVLETWSERKSYGDEKEKWAQTNMDRTPRIKRRERALYGAANKASGGVEFRVEGMGNGTTSKPNQKTKRLSKLLQTRCRERISQDRSGVRRGISQLREIESERQEEGRQIKGVRVESVEVLELRDIKRRGLYRDPDYVYCIDVEDNHNFFANGILTHNCQKAKAGVSSQMGKAFLNIAERCKGWTGYTGTPGDVWISFYPYFQATGRVRNKTHFQREFCNIQTYKGYPEIVGYYKTETLDRWWSEISYSPDTSKVYAELPAETHKVVEFKAGADYKKFMKNKDRKRIDTGEFLETNMAVQHYIRQLCSTKEKLDWLKDFAETTDRGAVIFYSYILEGEQIEETLRKSCPNSKIWRINGKHHEIPTAETIGEKDFVVTHWSSGSEALNLQFLNQWISYSPNYSYSTSVQARGRIKRLGQKLPMFYWYLKCSGTVEDNIYKALRSKSDFANDTWMKDNGLWIDDKEGG